MPRAGGPTPAGWAAEPFRRTRRGRVPDRDRSASPARPGRTCARPSRGPAAGL